MRKVKSSNIRLAMNMKPIPTILHPKKVVDKNSEVNSIS